MTDTATLTHHGLVVADTADLDRVTWLNLRKRGIGGSDAAAICGLDRWRSPMEVYLDKTGELDDRDAGEAAQWGNLLEPVVADEFTRRTGLPTVEAGQMLAHPEHQWMLANLDRLVTDKDGNVGILEVKTTSVYLADEWADDAVPDRAHIQTLHYLAVTGCAFAYVVVLIGGQRLEVRRVERDEKAIAHLVSIETEFWERVLDGNPPPADGTDACTTFLASYYEIDPDKIAVLTPDVTGLLEQRAEAKADEKAAKTRAAEAQNRICQLMEGAEVGYLDGEVVCTWKQVPEAAVAATTRKAHRRFAVKKGATRG